MVIQTWLVVGLASFDLMIVVAAYFCLRAYPPMDRRALCGTGAGLTGFVFHAFLFFDGAFLILQLSTIAAIFGICWLRHLGSLSKRKESLAE